MTVVTNQHIGDLDRQLERFYGSIQPGALALFYYSGHGGSVGEENYLLPIEFQQQDTESGVIRSAAAMSAIRNRMEARGAKVRLLIFDACRNSSLIATKDAAGGLAKLEGHAEGTVIAYASAHGQVSRFSTSARNSYYTALVNGLRSPKTDLMTLLNDTADAVYRDTGRTRMPHLYGRLFGKLYLGNAPEAIAPTPVAPGSPEISAWRAVMESNDAALLRNVTPVVTPVARPELQAGVVKINPKDGAAYVWIAGGQFHDGVFAGRRRVQRRREAGEAGINRPGLLDKADAGDAGGVREGDRDGSERFQRRRVACGTGELG